MRSALFDESFFLYCEDTDLGLRARWAGWESRYVPEPWWITLLAIGRPRVGAEGLLRGAKPAVHGDQEFPVVNAGCWCPCPLGALLLALVS